MFDTSLSIKTDTLKKIENLEMSMLQSIQMAEDFGQEGDVSSQTTCMTSAIAYGTAVLVLRKKIEVGELL
jgi:hypothetical protein